MIIGAILVYAPMIHFQRRLSNGLDIPFALLGGLVIARGIEKLRFRWVKCASFSIIVLGLAATNITLISVTAKNLFHGVAPYQANLSADEATILSAIRTNVPDDQAILSEIWVGNTVAGLTGKTVVIGHGQQTVGVEDKLVAWDSFVAKNTSAQERRAIIQRLKARWLLWRPQIDNQGYSPDEDVQWVIVKKTPTMSLYRLE